MAVRVPRSLLLPAIGWAMMTAGAAKAATISVDISGLRNGKGLVHLCLTRNEAYFPDCGRDPAAIKRTVPAGNARSLSLAAIPAGAYALSVFHDENGNQKLDTFLKVPKEGFGFSRNPVIRFGPPKYSQVRFDVGAGMSRQQVRMQYLL